MLEPTKDEIAVICDDPALAELLLTCYEPTPRVNAFCPHLNAFRIIVLKGMIAKLTPSPLEFKRAKRIVVAYLNLFGERRWHKKACEIADLFGCKDPAKIRQIEKLLQNEV